MGVICVRLVGLIERQALGCLPPSSFSRVAVSPLGGSVCLPNCPLSSPPPPPHSTLQHFIGHENVIQIYDLVTVPPDTVDFRDVYIVTNLMVCFFLNVMWRQRGSVCICVCFVGLCVYLSLRVYVTTCLHRTAHLVQFGAGTIFA